MIITQAIITVYVPGVWVGKHVKFFTPTHIMGPVCTKQASIQNDTSAILMFYFW